MSSGLRRWQRYVRDAHVRTYGGIDLCVYPLRDTQHEEVIFHRLSAALRLIYEVQPWRRRMLPRHIKRILSIYPRGAEYVPDIKACVIGYKFVEEGSIQQIAEAIIHEFTHARIETYGIEYTEATRARIEHLCLKSELNFARAAVSAPRLTRGQVSVSDPWWTEEHRVRRILEQLRELGVPEWIISAAVFVYRAKSRLANRNA